MVRPILDWLDRGLQPCNSVALRNEKTVKSNMSWPCHYILMPWGGHTDTHPHRNITTLLRVIHLLIGNCKVV